MSIRLPVVTVPGADHVSMREPLTVGPSSVTRTEMPSGPAATTSCVSVHSTPTRKPSRARYVHWSPTFTAGAAAGGPDAPPSIVAQPDSATSAAATKLT